MSFKDISYLQLWWPFCSAEPNHLCNFSIGHYGEHFKFGLVVQEMLFISSSAAHLTDHA